MKLSKATQRDIKLQRRKRAHIVDGRSVFVLEAIQRERAEKIKQARELKESSLGV